MAEVLGAVASGMGVAAFAVQIGANAQRLVALWKSIRNAPQHIHDLLVEIDGLAEILADFEAAQLAGHSVAHSPPARGALHLCKGVAEDLKNVLEKFEAVLRPSSSTGIKQRTWFAVKATFKEAEMEEQLQRLERAKTTLLLAGNYSTFAQLAAFRLDQAAENEDLRALITGLTNDTRASVAGDLPNRPAIKYRPTTSRVKDGSIKSQLVHRSYWTPFGPVQHQSSSKQKQAEETSSGGYSSWSYWPSSWTFLEHGLEVLRDCSLGRPHFVFRTFRVAIKAGDPAIFAAGTGDLPELKRLCALGQASPFDRHETGFSLLHIAVVYKQPQVCSWLVEHGVPVDEMLKGHRLFSPLTIMAHPEFIITVANEDLMPLVLPESFLSPPQSEHIASLLSMAKILLNATEIDAHLIKLATTVADYPSLATLERVHDYANTGYYRLVLPITMWSICRGLSDIFRHLLTDLELLNGNDSDQLHRDCELRAFLNHGLSIGTIAWYREEEWLPAARIAKFLIYNLPGHDLLHERPEYDEEKDCCQSQYCLMTPLLWLFVGFFVLKSQNQPICQAHIHVKIWLSALRMAGVDLLAYLKTEEESDVWIGPIHDQACVQFRLRFKYGNSDEDHRVWANYKIVRFPSQIAKDSAAQMPGGWKDFDEWDAIEPTGTIGRPIDIDSEDDESHAWDDEPDSEDGDIEAGDEELESESGYRDARDYELETKVEEEAEVS